METFDHYFNKFFIFFLVDYILYQNLGGAFWLMGFET